MLCSNVMLYIRFIIYIPSDCKSIFGLRAIALMLSGENFLSGCNNVGNGVSR